MIIIWSKLVAIMIERIKLIWAPWIYLRLGEHGLMKTWTSSQVVWTVSYTCSIITGLESRVDVGVGAECVHLFIWKYLKAYNLPGTGEMIVNKQGPVSVIGMFTFDQLQKS